MSGGLAYSLSFCYLGVENYKKALQVITDEKNHKWGALANKLTRHLLILLLYYEVGDEDKLENKIRSVYRMLKRKPNPPKYESILLNFIRTKMPRMISKTEINAGFVSLENELLLLDQDVFERKGMADFDLLSWIQSKIQNRSFGEIVREKAYKKATENR